MSEFLPYLIVALIYGFVAIDFWRHAKNPTEGKSMRWHSAAIAFGLVIHAGLLYKSIFIGDEDLVGINFGFATALSLIFWLTVAIYWITDIKQTYNSLQAFVLPPAAFFVLLHGGLREFNVLPYADQPLFLAHLIIALVAYSLFTFAALHALLMAAAERSMHKKPTLIHLPEFPPLITMESLLFKVIGLGFLLLTLTLGSGMMFSEHVFNQAFQFNHKNIFALLSWLIYGGLLIGRNAYGWRGPKAIRWTLGGFVLLLLAYVGSKFVFQFLLRG
ncbi:MAG: cytochrome c biogenesis protein CcsA [Nitrosomonadales bacterium]|nr:cytochrome c biogenesis protein CcsA [Nitrosomonadales bacterium]